MFCFSDTVGKTFNKSMDFSLFISLPGYYLHYPIACYEINPFMVKICMQLACPIHLDTIYCIPLWKFPSSNEIVCVCLSYCMCNVTKKNNSRAVKTFCYTVQSWDRDFSFHRLLVLFFSMQFNFQMCFFNNAQFQFQVGITVCVKEVSKHVLVKERMSNPQIFNYFVRIFKLSPDRLETENYISNAGQLLWPQQEGLLELLE